ncbi:TrmH family RNA methyltransferase [Salsuginibacillus halophilus]|uniref:TrmH family RNA methyltransferase n=1 Tax=Salsuginibacillus halophilus TaxID=517424 RepID=A0A2P8HCS4_9BACI|nr:RNA methyltransferase [Salsuginibacillus halophilus]PSL44044.1 TrmH family RNA methyltransferase [Salsuginibacillus halophilus]
MERIESSKNQKVKDAKRLRYKKYRERDERFLIEGPHLIEEALKSGREIERIFADDPDKVPDVAGRYNIPTALVNEQVIQELTGVQNPQGLVAVCMIPSKPEKLVEGIYLLLDEIQDPGNVGTMIRTADAAGAKGVILGEGSADVYNEKAVRATQGSIFHIPVIQGPLEEWIDQLKEQGVPILGTGIAEGTSHTALAPLKSFALIVGNEGGGVKPELLEKTDQNVYIPIHGDAESLNVSVATGILLYHLRKG